MQCLTRVCYCILIIVLILGSTCSSAASVHRRRADEHASTAHTQKATPFKTLQNGNIQLNPDTSAQRQLWVNPNIESKPGVPAADHGTPVAMPMGQTPQQAWPPWKDKVQFNPFSNTSPYNPTQQKLLLVEKPLDGHPDRGVGVVPSFM
jgi:hypothetical protein